MREVRSFRATIELNQIQGTLSPDSPAASSYRTEIFLLVIQPTVSTRVSSCRIRRFRATEKCPRASRRVCVHKRPLFPFSLFALSPSPFRGIFLNIALVGGKWKLAYSRGNVNRPLIRSTLNGHETAPLNCHWQPSSRTSVSCMYTYLCVDGVIINFQVTRAKFIPRAACKGRGYCEVVQVVGDPIPPRLPPTANETQPSHSSSSR